MPDVVLTVNGQQYGGWKKAAVRIGIEQISGSFELEVTERWAGRSEPWPIRHGEACTVQVDGETVITGHVDDVLPQFDATQHGVTVVGRDATGDLVDCSAIAKSSEWQGRTLLQVAEDLARPFGVKVIAETEVGAPFQRSRLQQGETVFEALERAARMRGVLLVSDGQGNLVITRAGKQRIGTALVQGGNILRGSATFSLRERFSRYVCKGQAPGSDFSSSEQNAQIESKPAADGEVKRYRPLIVIAESSSDTRGLNDRALWEAAVRLGRSARPVITVQGWRHADGLWRPNRLVQVAAPYFHLDREMLIVSVAYTIGEGGTFTELELCRPEAFQLLPIPEPENEGDFLG